MFEKEITEMCRHDLYYVSEVKEKPLPIDSLMKTVSATLPDTVSVTGVTISPDPERAWQMSLSKPRRAAVYVDQYTGEVKGRSERLAFYDVMFHMHRWMMGSSQGFGKLLVGISTLLLVIILITGILMWLTNRKKPLKKSLTISFTKGWPKFWHDLHVAGGIYATIFLLALALTGLTWSFSWYRSGFYAMFGVEASAGGHGGSHGGGERGARGGQRGDRPDGGRDGRHEGRRGEGRRDSVDVSDKDADRNRRQSDAQEERAGRRGRGNEGHRGRGNSESGVSDDINVRSEHGEYAESRHGDGEIVETEDSRAERHGGADGEGRRRRGGRGGRYHHDSDSAGTYAGRHSADSLRRGHYHDGDEAGSYCRGRGRAGDADAAVEQKNDGGRKVERVEKAGRRGNDAGKHARGNEQVSKRRGMADKALADSSAVAAGNAVDSVLVNDAVSPFVHWQDVYELLVKENPDYRQITLSDGMAGLVPAGRNSLRAADRYEFDPATGQITGCKPYSDQDKAGKVRSGVYTVHVGSWGGMVTRIITFLAALLGATLPLTGYYLWIRRLIMKRRNRQSKRS